VKIERNVSNNKPDIIIRGKEKATCLLINIPFPGDRNSFKKEGEILKIKGLSIKTQLMWNQR
jgi:hypothetical protein